MTDQTSANQQNPALPHNEDGILPARAWPGGYPILYLMADGESLCSGCANGKNGSETLNPECDEDPQWTILEAYVHWEGPPAFCSNCNAEVESAYGDPEEEDS